MSDKKTSNENFQQNMIPVLDELTALQVIITVVFPYFIPPQHIVRGLQETIPKRVQNRLEHGKSSMLIVLFSVHSLQCVDHGINCFKSFM